MAALDVGNFEHIRRPLSGARQSSVPDAVASNTPVSVAATNPTATANAIGSPGWLPGVATGDYVPAPVSFSFGNLVFYALLAFAGWWAYRKGYLSSALHHAESAVRGVTKSL